MSWFTDIQDRIAEKLSGYFVSDDAEQTAREVAAAQQQRLDASVEAGRIDRERYNELTAQNAGNATALEEYEEAHSDIAGAGEELILGTGEVIGHGVDAVGKTVGKTIWNAVPWWVWVLGIIALLVWAWPFLAPLLLASRRKGTTA